MLFSPTRSGPQPHGCATHERRRIATLILASLLAQLSIGTLNSSVSRADPPRVPNLIFILADDQGWADIGYHGSDIRTPHLDRLAAEGVRLNRHYVYATCSPTRVALLSGRYPSRYGVLAPLSATTHMRGTDAHLPRGLQQLGYRTHITGKWHIGETSEHRPLNYGFDTTYGYLRGQIDPYTHRYKHGNHVTWHRNDVFFEEEGHVTDLITREAIRVIEQADERPFFLYVAHHSPHAPLNEPPQWIEPYETSIEDIWRRHFAAAVTHVDAAVGELVQALERTGRRKETLIIYSSDNGGQRQWPAPVREYNGRYAPHTTLGNNAPLRGWKGDLYEGGIRVPCFVNWPGVLGPGKVVDSPTHTVDWAATLLRLAGGQPDAAWDLEGVDLWPMLTGEETQPRPRTLYWRTPQRMALRRGNWKLIVNRQFENPELFDLGLDPHEETDLAAAQPERVQQLLGLLKEHHARDWSEQRP